MSNTTTQKQDLEARLKGRAILVSDWPRPGVKFVDLNPVLADARLLRAVISHLAAIWASRWPQLTHVAGVESRGFTWGTALAVALGTSFTPIRKAGKLPRETRTIPYQLEYGTGTLEIQTDALRPKDQVLVVDDVLATGGTAAAAAVLVSELGAIVTGFAFVAEIPELGGRALLHRALITVIARY